VRHKIVTDIVTAYEKKGSSAVNAGA